MKTPSRSGARSLVGIALLVLCVPTSWSDAASRPSQIATEEDYIKRAAVVGHPGTGKRLAALRAADAAWPRAAQPDTRNEPIDSVSRAD